MRIAGLKVAFAGTILLIGCGGPLAPPSFTAPPYSGVRRGPGPAAVSRNSRAQDVRLSETFRVASENSLPSVVHIRVVGRVLRLSEMDSAEVPPAGSPLPPFTFRIPEGFAVGAGSGFIFDDAGHILTNHHVVESAVQVSVQLSDGREFDARIVGTDPTTDVAVLKIDPGPGEALPVASLGASQDVEVGDWVLAIGSPLGLRFTATGGIVGAIGRNIGILGGQGAPPLEIFIQTDAAINPGNSGGPLVNMEGRVIGINTALESPTGVYAGYGFAVPMDLARRVADDLIGWGVVLRPVLGARLGDPTGADARVFGLPSVAGSVVRSVRAGGPADRAGLRMGDVVTAVDGRPVRNTAAFLSEVVRREPGDLVRLELFRYSVRTNVTLTLGAEAISGAGAMPPDGALRQSALGFRVRRISTEEARDLGLRRGGVVVTELDPTTEAADAGVFLGQVVLRINGEEIESAEDVERVAAALRRGQDVSLVILQQSGAEVILNFPAYR